MSGALALPLLVGKQPKSHLGSLLVTRRAGLSRAEFARRLGLSYTFVREMEAGNRFPSERTIEELAPKMGVDAGHLALLVHCDRSPLLAGHLAEAGVLPDPVAGSNHGAATRGSAGTRSHSAPDRNERNRIEPDRPGHPPGGG